MALSIGNICERLRPLHFFDLTWRPCLLTILKIRDNYLSFQYDKNWLENPELLPIRLWFEKILNNTVLKIAARK